VADPAAAADNLLAALASRKRWLRQTEQRDFSLKPLQSLWSSGRRAPHPLQTSGFPVSTHPLC